MGDVLPSPTTDTTGETVCPAVGCVNPRGEACDAKPRCLNLAAIKETNNNEH